MKRSMLLLFSSIAILMTGCATSQNELLASKPVPEATNVDPEKYTLRFIQATGEGPAFAPMRTEEPCSFDDATSEETIYTDEWSTSRFGESAPPLSRDKFLLSKIENSNPTYTELVSLQIEMGREFLSDNGLLKGKVWCGKDFSSDNGLLKKGVRGSALTDSTTAPSALASFELKHDFHPIKFDETPLLLKVDDWICIGLGDSKKTEWILVKLYAPQR